MTGRLLRSGAVGLAICAGLGVLTGCTAAKQTATFTDPGVATGSFQLVAFDTCDNALNQLRAAAKAAVGPYGFGNGPVYAMEGDMAGRGAPGMPPAPAAAGANAGEKALSSGGMPGAEGTPNYSGTNTHEVGVDEPDLVKTDGRRIVTISGGTLRVVDAASHQVTGSLRLTDPSVPVPEFQFFSSNMLLSGDHVLVLGGGGYPMMMGGGPVPSNVDIAPGGLAGGAASGAGTAQADPAAPKAAPTVAPPPVDPIYGPRMLLVDISGTPRVLSSYAIDGNLVDARQVGSTARVVLRSYPRLIFPYNPNGTDANRIDANRKIIDRTGLDTWLPRIEVSANGSVTRPRIGCDAVSRPAVYTGTNLVTVLTFDLGASALGDGAPATLIADGDTVYSNGPSLYVASDQRWQAMSSFGAKLGVAPEARTDIYKFDTSTPGRPAFVGGGSVPGYLLNQYAMSEWNGNLRVATTTGQPWAPPGQQIASHSGVYVLAPSGDKLRQIGAVDGLGTGERIYAVRFAGPVGYVVTFRQTDPLYTVDLRDPAKPTVRGELKISGYSAYLHPISDSLVIGIGQEATNEGRVTGTQVSLFNVADLGSPKLVAHYTLDGAHSTAEFDPHAFLYWPTNGLLVIPLQVYNVAPATGKPGAGSAPGTAKPPLPPTGSSGGSSGTVSSPTMPVATIGALILRVTGDGITEVGFISHPAPRGGYGYPAPIERSLIIDQTLWTVSQSGLMATDDTTLRQQSWVRFA
jgi:hypothetical protein